VSLNRLPRGLCDEVAVTKYVAHFCAENFSSWCRSFATSTVIWTRSSSKSQHASRFCELQLPCQPRAKLPTRAQKLRAVKVGSFVVDEMRATTGIELRASRFKQRPSSTPAASLMQARQLREAQSLSSSLYLSTACRAAHEMKSLQVSMWLTSARKTSLAGAAASQFLQSFGRAVPASRSTLRVSVSCRCRFNREPSSPTRARKLRTVKVGSFVVEEVRAATGIELRASRFKQRLSSTPAAALMQARKLREVQSLSSSLLHSTACSATHAVRPMQVSIRLTSARKTSLAGVAASQLLRSL